MFRCRIPPFTQSRSVLEPLLAEVKREEPDILELCNIVPKEVLSLAGGKGASQIEPVSCFVVQSGSNGSDYDIQGPSSGQSPDFVLFSFQSSGPATWLHGSYRSSPPVGANAIKTFLQTVRLTG